MVFLHHHGPDVPALQGPVLQAIIGQLFSGVVLFFVLSGFLIADRYFESSTTHFRSYFIRRIFRIVPLYFVLTALTFFLQWYRGGYPPHSILVELIANLTFLRGWFGSLWATGVLQGWSLTVEMTFYLLAPIIFIMIKWRRTMFFLLPIIFIGTGVCLVLLTKGSGPLGFMESFHFLFGITFLGRCFEFFVGITIAMALRGKGDTSFRHATLVGGVLCILVMGVAGYFDVGYGEVAGVLLNNLLLPIGVGIFYWGLLTEQSLARKALSSPIAVFMGTTSFAFYLIHVGVICTAIYALTRNMVITFILPKFRAWLLYHGLEEPAARWARVRFPMSARPQEDFRSTSG